MIKTLIKMIDSLRAIKLNANDIDDDMNYALAQRLLAYIGIVSYSFTVNLYQQNSPSLPNILKIYEYIEPTNKDMLYFQVKWYQKIMTLARLIIISIKATLYIQISKHMIQF